MATFERSGRPGIHRSVNLAAHAAGAAMYQMSVTSDDSRVAPDVLAAAREFIRSKDGCVVSMSELLDELSDDLSEQCGAGQAVWLIEELWADAHIDQIPESELIEFAWSEAGRY
jgi:hypothetical protein